MTLALPSALIALAMLALPLWLHRRRPGLPPPRPFPFIALLPAAIRQPAQSRRRWQQPVLLGLRLAALTALVVAAAQPSDTQQQAFGAPGAAALIIAIDDSLSMAQRSPAHRTLCQQAQHEAHASIDAAAKGSQIAVIATGKPARVLAGPSHDRQWLHQALHDLPCVRPDDSAAAWRLAAAVFRRMPLSQRRLLWFSDGLSAAPKPAMEGVAWWQPALSKRQDLGNTALRSLHIRHRDAQQLTIRAVIDHHDRRSLQLPLRLHTWQNHRLLQQSQVQLRPGTVLHDITIPKPKAATLALQGEIVRHDALPLDNHRTLLLAPARRTEVLVVEGDPQGNVEDNESALFVQALRTAQRDQAEIHLRHLAPASVRPALLQQTDLVLWMNVALPQTQVATWLETFVRQGGGLLLAFGDALMPHTLPPALRRLLPATAIGIESGSYRLQPAPRTVARTQDWAPYLVHTQVQRRWQWLPKVGAVPLLHFDDGTPALLRQAVGQGQVAALALPLDDTWSDLPYQSGFLPLADALLQTLSAPAGASPAATVPGSRVWLRPERHVKAALLRFPDGSVHPWNLAQPGRRQRTDVLMQLGPYLLTEAATEQALAFVVQLPVTESRLRPTLAASAKTDGAVGRSRVQRMTTAKPLALPLAWIALSVLVLESLWRLRRRWRVPVTALSLVALLSWLGACRQPTPPHRSGPTASETTAAKASGGSATDLDGGPIDRRRQVATVPNKAAAPPCDSVWQALQELPALQPYGRWLQHCELFAALQPQLPLTFLVPAPKSAPWLGEDADAVDVARCATLRPKLLQQIVAGAHPARHFLHKALTPTLAGHSVVIRFPNAHGQLYASGSHSVAPSLHCQDGVIHPMNRPLQLP